MTDEYKEWADAVSYMQMQKEISNLKAEIAALKEESEKMIKWMQSQVYFISGVQVDYYYKYVLETKRICND